MVTECLGESDVNELAQAALTDFDQEVASLSEELCVPFNQAAGQLEAGLLNLLPGCGQTRPQRRRFGQNRGVVGNDGFAVR